MGFFPYYCDDDDMSSFHAGSINTVASGAYVYVYDFLSTKELSKHDKHTPGLSVYKRTLRWWLNYFQGFELVSFRLFSSSTSDHGSESLEWIETVSEDDWEFAALFRRQ